MPTFSSLAWTPLSSVILYGTRANQPAPQQVLAGTLYAITDEGCVERAAGTIWEPYVGGVLPLQLKEVTVAPTPVADAAILFAQDNGAGKTQLMVQFPTGAAIQLSIEL